MAASNESQGLKIAVAIFIALSVILSVTCYFLYSNYSQAEAKLAQASEKQNTQQKSLSIQQNYLDELRGRIGVRAEESDAAKAEIEAHYKKVYEKLDGLGDQVNTALQKVQQSGASPQELQDLQGKVQGVIQSFRAENTRNYISSLDRLTELMENLALLTTEMGTNYLDLRKTLEADTTVNRGQLEVQTRRAEAAVADVMEEQRKHVEDAQALLTKVDALTKENDLKTAEIANLTDRIRQMRRITRRTAPC